MATDMSRPDLETLAAVIAHSQIVLRERTTPGRCLPEGFDEVDVAILDWIAKEGRCVVGRLRARM